MKKKPVAPKEKEVVKTAKITSKTAQRSSGVKSTFRGPTHAMKMFWVEKPNGRLGLRKRLVSIEEARAEGLLP